MAFDGTEGDQIELATASTWTANYRNANPGATKGHFFGKDIINQILNQSGCMGIRIYYAHKDTAGTKELILVGAKNTEDDMYKAVVADFSRPCPNICGSSNPLNS